MAFEAPSILAQAQALLAEHRPGTAALEAHRALQLYQEAGDQDGASSALHSAVLAQIAAGNPEAAVSVAKDAVALCKKRGDMKGEAAALQDLAHARLASGAVDTAMSASRRALPLLKELKDLEGQARALHLIAAAQFGKGYWELALRAAREARQALVEAGKKESTEVARRELETLIASAHHARGEEPPSSAYRTEALQVLAELGRALEDRDGAKFEELSLRLATMGGFTETDTNRVYAPALSKDPEGTELFLAAHAEGVRGRELPAYWTLVTQGLEGAPEGWMDPFAAPEFVSLRSFPCSVNMEGSQGEVEWTQTLGQIRLSYPLVDGPRTSIPGGWAQEDIRVMLSKSSLKVTRGDQDVKEWSGDLLEDIWRKDSWWAVEEETPRLVITLFKRRLGTWRTPWYNPKDTVTRRTAFPWNDKMKLFGSQHNSPLHGYPPPLDLPDESTLEIVLPGRPEPEEDEPQPGGGYARSLPGGLFAPPSSNYICCAEDICLGITAEQDGKHVTIQVHFERFAYDNMLARMPPEKLFAADIWPNHICIFLQGDKQNPIVWGELTSACNPLLTIWRLGTSEAMRRRQEKPSGYSPALIIRLRKAPGSEGEWPKIFSSCLQAKLMAKGWEPGRPRYEGLPGTAIAPRAGYDLQSADFWSLVDGYCDETIKKTGYSTAPKKLMMA